MMKQEIRKTQALIFLLVILIFSVFFTVSGCEKKEGLPVEPDADANGHTAPTKITAKSNSKAGEKLPLNSPGDFENAWRGFIARDEALEIKNGQEENILSLNEYGFMDKDTPPASVNPGLWRQGRLNNIHGLFKVTEGIYQVRGYDLANMTLIRGEKGWIIVDPLTSEETSAKALALARAHLGDRQVSAVIFTHSHIDHFGGIRGILTEEEAIQRKVRIIAPRGFMEEATSENIIAGIAMGRRSMFMYGKNLARSQRGHVDTGLGKELVYGTFGILEPSEIIDRTGEEKTIDGVCFVFQYAPESEAPAELTFYLPDFKAFCGAEIISHTMHNLYTLRGAKICDPLKWSAAIEDAMERFSDAKIYFGCHHWPVWGNTEIISFMTKQRDLYKYIHDQTVRLFNTGLTPSEIAETLELPESFHSSFSQRGYYGTLKHNARAVYQAYLGWYDGNPALLDPLPPEESGRRYVEMMGGPDAVLEKARQYFDKGEYRWVAEILNHLVFADPGDQKPKALLARTYDQLGYQAESGPWRDIYLSGALELRHGSPPKGLDMAIVKGILEKTPVALFFDSMATRLNGLKADGKIMTVKIMFTDIKEIYLLKLENCVLHHRKSTSDTKADVTIKITRRLFVRMLTGQAGLKDTIFSDNLSVDGSKLDLLNFLLLFEKPSGAFNIVTP